MDDGSCEFEKNPKMTCYFKVIIITNLLTSHKHTFESRQHFMVVLVIKQT